MSVLLLLASLAHADVPLPDYDRALARAEWVRVDRLLQRGCSWDPSAEKIVCADEIHEAIARARAFQEIVLPDASLQYLVGLGYKYQGKDGRAKRAYRAALDLDPTLVEAWYDLGEILLAERDLDGAENAFRQVAGLLPTGDRAWLGLWRLAEVAAHRGDAATFEAQLKEALKRGFSFQTVRGLPNWKAFYADPALRDSIEKLVTVYGTRDVLESFAE